MTDNEVVYAEEARVAAILKLPGGKSAVVMHETLNGGGIFNVIGEVPSGPSPQAQARSTPAPLFRASSGAYLLDIKFQSGPDLRLGYDPDLYDPPGDADLDGDGVLDIPMLIVQDDEVEGIIVRNGATLDILWEFSYPAEHRENLLKGFHGFADADGDGEKEAIMGDNLAVTLDGVVHTIAANFVTLDVNDVDGDGFEDIMGLNLPDSSIVIYGIGLVSPSVEATVPTTLPGFLFQSYPNPFHDHTTIVYEIAQPGPVVIAVYDVLGRRVHTLVDDIRTAGRHELTWNGRDSGGRPLANGTYFYRLEADGVRTTRQALYIR